MPFETIIFWRPTLDTEFQVRTYCPWDLTEFDIPIENRDVEEAKKKVIDRTAVCPHGHRFHVEDVFIVSVYPKSKALPRITYPPLEESGFLRGADVVGDKPLPSKAFPYGYPRLVRKVSDGIETFIFEQELRSPTTDERFFVRMKRDAYRKFVSEAEQIASQRVTHIGVVVAAGDAKAAIDYLLQRESPLSATQLAAMLKLPRTTVYSAMKRLTDEDKVISSHRTRLWGRLYYSQTPKSRDEIIKELASIKELEEKRKLSIEDFREILSTVNRHEKEIRKQEVLASWLPDIDIARQREPRTPPKPTATIPKVAEWFTERRKKVVKAGFYSLGRYRRLVKFVDVPVKELDKLSWAPIRDLDDWKCEETMFHDMKLVRCRLETLEGAQEKIIALPPLAVGKHGEQLTRAYSLRTE